ncbi:MAG: pilus assembly protein TadG-related protein [Hyphomicrobiales bacterium]
MFGISVVPLLVAVGVGIDYERVINVRTKLNGAADTATLAAVSKSATPFVTTPTQAQVQQYFNALATRVVGASVSGVTMTGAQATITQSVTNLTVTLTYTAQVKTMFGGIIGTQFVTIGGSSTAQTNAPPYIDFYLLLDNSPSMGLGATPADISNLITLTASQSSTVWPNVKSGSIARSNCAFACHQHTFNSSGQITGDDTGDNYHVAKLNGVTTRIDVLRTATQQLTQTATNFETMANQFRMAVYTFSDTFQTVAPLSSNMSTVSADAGAIDLAYAYWDQRDAQTSYDTALQYINGIMPNSSNGSTSSAPEEFLFLVTDGVEDAPVKGCSGSGDPADSPSSYLPLNNKPNIANTLTGNVNSNCRLIDMIKSGSGTMCDTIKNPPRNIKIAILYTPYQPVTSNGFYNTWVAASPLNNNNPVNPNDPTDPASNGIGIALKACATPGFYFQVTPTQGISAAMQAMFQAAVNSVLLTH